MGNGSSQSIVLGPPRLQAACPVRNGYHYQRGVPKYVHPQNRVLPKPVVGQRLRSTDNGSILQTAGTIRGQRRDSVEREDNVDPEVMGILRKRSEMIEKENDGYHNFNLRNHRLFHSDPDIARRQGPGPFASEEILETYGGNRRSSSGGVAMRASKLKYKKKARAPDPPPTGSNFSRQMERRPQKRNGDEDRRNQKNAACKCINKTKAPQPPSTAHPPPPPPLPVSETTRTKIGSPNPSSQLGESSSGSSITRVVECRDPKQGYAKNVHPLEKWRNCRSTGDIRIDEQTESASRTTIFDSRKVQDNHGKLLSHLPLKPDPFQKEIQAVTKKIAESRQTVEPVDISPQRQKEAFSKPDVSGPHQNVPNSSPPKFYFADTGVFKTKGSNQMMDSKADPRSPLGKVTRNDIQPKEDKVSREKDDRKPLTSTRTTLDEIVPSLQRFSPGRQRVKSPNRNHTPTPQQKSEKEWEMLSHKLCEKQDDDSDIDIRLRPVLPRKPPEMPKFSPSEAWQALGSDGQGSSNQSTSDDGPESMPAYKKGLLSTSKLPENRPRRLSDMTYGEYENRNNARHKHRSMSDSHWTPRQDLLDDSDVSSDDSEEAVVPRIRANSGEIPMRFSMPSVMFSNMRPIGSELKPIPVKQPPYLSDPKVKHAKKKTPRYVEPFIDHSMAPGFRKFLNRRNKYLSEEDIAVSDSNWTFGQHNLQKRGKQYSSDLMLSDKKKHEFMAQSNFGDFLGDILISKSNHMRNQMKSSDSGNSNFSFYSTDGQIMFAPEKGGFVKDQECSPPTKGRVYDIRRRFDPNLEPQRHNYQIKADKKKPSPTDIDLTRKRDLELAKMLEDEVRKRRNKEKITIRQQLQRMKDLHSDDEDDEFDDEAYFTEPKSRDDSQSPFFAPGPSRRFMGSDIVLKPSHFARGGAVTAIDSTRLSHWQSSPALLEDSVLRNVVRPSAKGRLSSSSLMSSPDPDSWMHANNSGVSSWLQKQRNSGAKGPDRLRESSDLEHANSDILRMAVSRGGTANDGDVSSSPTPAPQKKERRKTNIYKQLMDIVRKEEKHLKNAENSDPNSRESSYSKRESSTSSCSESSSSSSYSYSDSSGSRNNGKNGVPANKEFHTSSYTNSSAGGLSSFQVAFVQPYNPSKGYRPVPFDVVASTSNGYRMPSLQEEGKQVQAEVS